MEEGEIIELGIKRPRKIHLGFTVNNQFPHFLDLAQKPSQYVDKSLIIKKIIDSNDDGFLITRPRRWGKTLFLEMLGAFFMPELDKGGNFLPVSHERMSVFQKLKIFQISTAKNPAFYIENFMGQFPVILVKMQPVITSLLDTMQTIMSKTYEKFLYIYRDLLIQAIFNARLVPRTSSTLDVLPIESLESELEFTRRDKNIINNKSTDVEKFSRVYKKESNLSELSGSLLFLCKLVRWYFGKKVFLLIDDYDLLVKTVKKSEEGEIIEFLREFIGIEFKGNDNVQKVIICGVYTIPIFCIFSDFKYLNHCNMQSGYFSENFGFTEQEVDLILNNQHFLTEDIKSEVKNYYNGYLIEGIRLYSPFSIIQFIRNYKCDKPREALKRYSCLAGDSGPVLEAFQKLKLELEDIINLLSNKAANFCIPWDLAFYPSYSNFIEVHCYLLEAGYITHEKMNTNFYKIPNSEVYTEFITKFLILLLKKVKNPLVKSVNNEFINTSTRTLENSIVFKTIVDNSISAIGNMNKISDTDFQHFLSFISVLAALHKNLPTHIIEQITFGGDLFFPMKNKSAVAIFHLYKNAETRERVKKCELEAVWEFLALKKYLGNIIEKTETINGMHIKMVIVRSIVCFPGNSRPKHVRITEIRFDNLTKLKKLCRLFNKLENPSILIPTQFQSNKAEIEEVQRKFLKEQNSETIFKLIEQYGKIKDVMTNADVQLANLSANISKNNPKK
jgi:hypothetical protein